ncbi:667_t:CDS:10, partial [Funneliformis caledonium]
MESITHETFLLSRNSWHRTSYYIPNTCLSCRLDSRPGIRTKKLIGRYDTDKVSWPNARRNAIKLKAKNGRLVPEGPVLPPYLRSRRCATDKTGSKERVSEGPDLTSPLFVFRNAFQFLYHPNLAFINSSLCRTNVLANQVKTTNRVVDFPTSSRMKYDTTKTIANLEDGVKRQKLNYGTDRGGREGEQEGNELLWKYVNCVCIQEYHALSSGVAGEGNSRSDIKRRALKPPSVWTHIVKYLDAVLNTPKEGFEDSLRQTMSDEPKFQLYCKKVLTDFWLGYPHNRASLKLMPTEYEYKTIKKRGIWNCITRIPVGSHTNGEEIKSDRITLYSLNLMEGGKFLAEELESAKIPFSFSSRMRYMGLLKMIARFHDKLMEQEEIIGKLEASFYVDKDESPKVRDVLTFPDKSQMWRAGSPAGSFKGHNYGIEMEEAFKRMNVHSTVLMIFAEGRYSIWLEYSLIYH